MWTALSDHNAVRPELTPLPLMSVVTHNKALVEQILFHGSVTQHFFFPLNLAPLILHLLYTRKQAHDFSLVGHPDIE